MSAIIFAGPSLPPAARPAAPELIWRPPARQGDVYRAALERPTAIGVIDGIFDVTPTVWHKEILWAMSQGIRVYGAASIGALRAAELADFGMIGVGDIYRQFRDGTLEDDDEVAMLHGPEETGYVPLTEAMVNVRATVARGVAKNVISATTGSLLLRSAKSLFFKRRSFSSAIALSAQLSDDGPALHALGRWLPKGYVNLKKSDAVALLHAMLVGSGAEVASARACNGFCRTSMWECSLHMDVDPAATLRG